MAMLDVRQLNAMGKYEGEAVLECELPADVVTLPLAEVGRASARGTYRIFEDDAVEVQGKVRYLLRGVCTRCLQPTEKWIEAEWNAVFIPGDPQDEEYGYQNGKIDLRKSVYDAVQLSMPYTLLCREDCEGIPYRR